MTHPLTEVIAEIQVCRKSVQAPWFQERTAKWLTALEAQVEHDLSTVDVLRRLDASTDAIAAARTALCETMGVDRAMPMAELLLTADAVFRGFMGVDEPDQSHDEHAA